MLEKTYFYYFSPTGGTKKAGEIFCEGISREVRDVNLGQRDWKAEQPESQVVVMAAPVFGGRIPGLVAERLGELKGNGKKAVTLAVYGTRAYEDALLELNRTAQAQGFEILASAALVAQHSIVPEVGAGRPDEEDRAEILKFAAKVLGKLKEQEMPEGLEGTAGWKNPRRAGDTVKVPGNYPHKEGMGTPVPPVSLAACCGCGKCEAVCPTDAICLDGKNVVTTPEKCILCMACVAACPQGARVLPAPVQERMNEKLGVLKDIRRENAFFL